MALEFARKQPDPETGRIGERQLAELLLTYADYTPKKRSAVIKRVKRAYKNTEEVVRDSVTQPLKAFLHDISKYPFS